MNKSISGADASPTSLGSVSGSAMDRVVSKKRPKYGFVLAALMIVLGGSVYLDVFSWRSGSGLNLEKQHLAVTEVTRGVFEDFVPVRARVIPKRTIYLDAVEGGRIEERLVEDGALVEQGQLLVRLSNTALQLDVTRNEAVITEQLNNIRTIELKLEQNRLQHKRNLVEINYRLTKLGRQVSRLTSLKNNASKSALEDAGDELHYYQNLKTVTLESQSSDIEMQSTQLEFLKQAGAQLEANLLLARNNLESLNVRAPVAGKLSGFDIEIGQSIGRGGRLGQLDDSETFKLTANIDEYYLGRVALNQPASADKGSDLKVVLSKIYPQVKNGQFQVDFKIENSQGLNMRRGQNVQLKLSLSDPVESLLINNGGFFQDTGGRWIFVLSQDGRRAEKRVLNLGRKNSDYIEVLGGLKLGEAVISSSYSGFAEMDYLDLSAN